MKSKIKITKKEPDNRCWLNDTREDLPLEILLSSVVDQQSISHHLYEKSPQKLGRKENPCVQFIRDRRIPSS